MSIIDKIKNIFQQEKKNIVFLFDDDESLKDDLFNGDMSDISIIEVNNNFFELKYKLEFDLLDQKVLLYHPYPKPTGDSLKRYPLLDLLKANSEVKLDDVSEFLSEYNLSDMHSTLVRKYIKQLKTKTNRRKLASILDVNHFNEENLKRGLISVILDFNSVVSRNDCIVKYLSLTSNITSFEKACKLLKELDLEEELLKWLDLLTGIKGNDLSFDLVKDVACKIKYNVITSCLEKTIKKDNYSKLKLERISDINKLQAFFQDWLNNQSLKEYVDIVFNDIAIEINCLSIMKWYGDDCEYAYYTEEMLIVTVDNLYHIVEQDPLKVKNESFRWMRNAILSEELVAQVSFLYHTANVYAILASYKSFVFNSAEEYVNEYTQELFKIDLHYRKAVCEFDKARDRLYSFENKAISVFESLNIRYDKYLIDLNVEWQNMLAEKNFNYKNLNIPKQYNFYKDNLENFDYKIVVIISDAMRYELGYELFDDLLADSKNNLSINHCLASIPSYTNLGMSNLLPNNGIKVEKGESDLVFKINGKTTNNSNRESILQMKEGDSSTIDFYEIMKYDRDEGREFIKNNRIVYVYHDWIDAIGDKRRTEYEAFEAGTKAIQDIKRLVGKLYGWNVKHVMMTSDHGFLFNYNELKEANREALPKGNGYIKDNSRFVISDKFEAKVDGYEMDLSATTNIDTDLKVAIPRATNRYRKQGNVGLQFVHGGASIQELLVPVVKFYKNKVDSNQYVSFKRIDKTDKIASGNLKLVLLQDEPVSNNHKKLDIVLALYGDNGDLYSNEFDLSFNSTSANPKERILEVILTLNTKGSNASFCYLKAFEKKDKNRLNPIVINDLIKISTLMEIDEF